MHHVEWGRPGCPGPPSCTEGDQPFLPRLAQRCPPLRGRTPRHRPWRGGACELGVPLKGSASSAPASVGRPCAGGDAVAWGFRVPSATLRAHRLRSKLQGLTCIADHMVSQSPRGCPLLGSRLRAPERTSHVCSLKSLDQGLEFLKNPSSQPLGKPYFRRKYALQN